ncbi:hypothetical protein BKA24_001805 [Microbacterium marinum]|uniref:Uncharacterized protein n=1 Tax=Microbacterium marinum TaxID=421115 RepID=A0A7W7BSK1_9MICO|nr:hypothetical protein [Microbacterium marinum]MBB4667096.1 hypothetical protein [Microbacterium marinum]
MHLIRAAITAGIRPSAMILRTQPSAPWDRWDFLLLEAYQIVQDERCDCGNPIWLCHHTSNDIQFRIDEVTCEATAYRERQEESRYGGPNQKRPHGVSLRAIPFSPSGAPLASFRRDYYRAQAKKREALNADAGR